MQELDKILQLLPQARGCRPEQVSIGRSRSSVYRLVDPTGLARFLKVSAADDASDLQTERECLGWLASRTSVPKVLDFRHEDGQAFLLTEALPGTNSTEAPARLWPRLIERVAIELRKLHSVRTENCPFDRTLDRVIPLARARSDAGQVDESDFDPERIGRSTKELLTSLCHERPVSEDIVVTHGDACLPNFIFNDDSFSGFVDCGRCGRSDRYQDLALAYRSIGSNYGGNLAENFLIAYGLKDIDAEKLSYYRLLDEFF